MKGVSSGTGDMVTSISSEGLSEDSAERDNTQSHGLHTIGTGDSRSVRQPPSFTFLRADGGKNTMSVLD